MNTTPIQQILSLCVNPKSKLAGQVIAYAKISIDAPDLKEGALKILNKTGIIAVKGDYRNHHNLKDFLANEFGNETAEKMEGLLESLKSRDDSEVEMIPVPARIMNFESEEEVLLRKEDIFFLGSFERAANAQLSISAFPILYQGAFREQEVQELQNQINEMINPSENTHIQDDNFSTLHYISYSGILSEYLAKKVIPSLIHASTTPNRFQIKVNEFRIFMNGYPFINDLDSIESLSRSTSTKSDTSKKILELLCLKIEAYKNQRFSEVKRLQARIESLTF
jgi:hypothetical protein